MAEEKQKEGENFNRRNTLYYFEAYNFRLTPKSGKLAICGRALSAFTVITAHSKTPAVNS